MLDAPTSLVDRVRNPEFTGANRCMPCTVVNVALTLVVTVALSFMLVELAGVFLLTALSLIYLRGYFVPGTPTLTERYLPTRIRSWFDDGPDTVTTFPQSDATTPSDSDTGRPIDANATTADGATQPTDRDDTSVDLMAFLSKIEVVEPCDEANDLCLTPSFEAAIQQRLEEFRTDPRNPSSIADLFGTEPDTLSFRDRGHPAIKVGSRIWSWPSDGALVADLAVDAALAARTDRWRAYHHRQRMVVLEALRTFFETCSLCGGPIDTARTIADSCCGSHDVVAVECVDCGERLLELDPSSEAVTFER